MEPPRKPILKSTYARFRTDRRHQRRPHMLNWDRLDGMIDWVIRSAAKAARSQLSLARNFVFSHLFGPALSQSISLFLYLSDPQPGVACWTVIICIWLFWAFPFIYRWSGSLH